MIPRFLMLLFIAFNVNKNPATLYYLSRTAAILILFELLSTCE